MIHDAIKRKKHMKLIAAVLILIVMLFILALFDLAWAPKYLSLGDVWDVLMGRGTWANSIIVNDINAPRIVIGILVGASLAIAGAVMQALFKNPMASPYILGLSSGASLGAVIGMLFVIPFIPTDVSVPVLAFVFCMGTMFLVYSIGRVGGHAPTETLLLAGIAVGAFLQAIVSFLTFISGDQLEGIVFWTMGSLSSVSWSSIGFVFPLMFVGITIMIMFSRDLNAMMLGDAHAMDLGVDVKKVRIILLIATSLVTASAVAFCGVIGFVGLVIPHIIRIILGPDNRLLLPMSILAGSTFMILCDLIAHVVAPLYGIIPIGVVTALIGAPYFIYLLTKRKREVGWN